MAIILVPSSSTTTPQTTAVVCICGGGGQHTSGGPWNQEVYMYKKYFLFVLYSYMVMIFSYIFCKLTRPSHPKISLSIATWKSLRAYLSLPESTVYRIQICERKDAYVRHRCMCQGKKKSSTYFSL